MIHQNFWGISVDRWQFEIVKKGKEAPACDQNRIAELNSEIGFRSQADDRLSLGSDRQ